MFRKILVPLDGSTFGEHALPLALSVARKCEAALRLAHIRLPISSIYAETPLFLEDRLEADFNEREHLRMQRYLDGLASRVRKVAPNVAATTVVDVGEPATMLEAEVKRFDADLVVMTTHARGALGRLWLGSVADELLRHLAIPLLLARPGSGQVDLASDPLPRHILLPLDGTSLAEQMLGPAVDLGKRAGAGFTLLRIIKPVVATTPPPLEGTFTLGSITAELAERIRTIQEDLRKEALAYLERVATPMRAQGLKVLTRVAVEEQPAVAVLREAEMQGPVLVALATHGRRGLARLVLGSVADKAVRGSQGPVLVCRPRP